MRDLQVIFDEENPNWNAEQQYNEMFLRVQKNWVNDLLKARGHVFLNEVYTSLGFPHTPAGAVLGWSLKWYAESHISFNVEPIPTGTCRLTFNVDGFILDKL